MAIGTAFEEYGYGLAQSLLYSAAENLSDFFSNYKFALVWGDAPDTFPEALMDSRTTTRLPGTNIFPNAVINSIDLGKQNQMTNEPQENNRFTSLQKIIMPKSINISLTLGTVPYSDRLIGMGNWDTSISLIEELCDQPLAVKLALPGYLSQNFSVISYKRQLNTSQGVNLRNYQLSLKEIRSQTYLGIPKTKTGRPLQQIQNARKDGLEASPNLDLAIATARMA